MRRVISIFISLVFFIWILPLGAFIKPGQEQQICNGQRAICLCSKLLAKKMSSLPDTIRSGHGVSTQKQAPAGGASHDFILISLRDHLLQPWSRSEYQTISSYRSPIIDRIDSVPKS